MNICVYVYGKKLFREIAKFLNFLSFLEILELSWIESMRTRADADAAHMRKVPAVMQMRQTRQMQIDEDACIRNWTDELTSRESHHLYRYEVNLEITRHFPKTLWHFVEWKDGAVNSPQHKQLKTKSWFVWDKRS